MPKSSSTPSTPVEVKPTKIPVFNHTRGMIGIGLSNRKAGTPGQGPEAYTVEFLPGNNSIDSKELERCQAHTLWHIHSTKQEKRDLTGRMFKSTDLEVGLHDPEFEVESEELGKRMFQIRQKMVS